MRGPQTSNSNISLQFRPTYPAGSCLTGPLCPQTPHIQRQTHTLLLPAAPRLQCLICTTPPAPPNFRHHPRPPPYSHLPRPLLTKTYEFYHHNIFWFFSPMKASPPSLPELVFLAPVSPPPVFSPWGHWIWASSTQIISCTSPPPKSSLAPHCPQKKAHILPDTRGPWLSLYPC